MSQPSDIRIEQVTTRNGDTFTLRYDLRVVAAGLVDAARILKSCNGPRLPVKRAPQVQDNPTVVPAISQ